MRPALLYALSPRQPIVQPSVWIVPAALPPLPILPATVPLLGTGEDRGLKSIAVIGKPIPGGGVTSNALTVKDSGGVSQQVAVIFQPAASFGEAMVAVVSGVAVSGVGVSGGGKLNTS